MPTTIWNNGRVYSRSEDVVAEIMNEQYSDRLQWATEKNLTIVQVRGVSDFVSQNVADNDEPIPFMLAPIFVEKEGASVRLDAHMQIAAINPTNTDAGYIYARIRGLSNVQAEFNLGNYVHQFSAYVRANKFCHTIPRLARGLYVFELWVHTDVGYVNINFTNTLAEFRVEEMNVLDHYIAGDRYDG